jgi:hypothetical protein
VKKVLAILLISGLLGFGGYVTGLFVVGRNAEREWPGKQLRNASLLGLALTTHKQTHGVYPARLEDLVAGGALNPEAFETLQFQFGPNADPQQWLYQTPDHPSDMAIVAPAALVPWNGHFGFTVTARANGAAELISHSKRSQIPAWARE